MGPKILILEHDPNDIALIQYELKKSDMAHTNKFVQTEQEFKDALLELQPDVVLSDFNLPSFNGINAFNVKQSILPEIPFIIISGTIGEQRAVDLIKMGVTDYVLKENLYQIPIKIRRALQEAHERRQKKEVEVQLADQKRELELSEMRFKALVQKGSDLINIIDPAGNLIYANPSFSILIGGNEEQVIGSNAFEYIHDDDKLILKRALSLIKRNKGVESATVRLKDSYGNYRWLQSTITNLCNDPAVQGILINSNDITERIHHINAIEYQNTKLKEIAWIQSHVVRAPLSRILGITNLILEAPDNYNEEWLRYLNVSAQELDEVVMEIVNRTEEAEKYGI